MNMSVVARTLTKALLLLTFATALLAGCATRSRVVVHTPRAKVVAVQKGHVHTHRCGHYKYKGQWYYVKGHVHKARCGHVKARGIWIIK